MTIEAVADSLTTIDYDTAREQLAAYRDALKTNARATDKLMQKVLRAAKKGRSICDLSLVMQKGGLDERGRPKLAIARADLERVHVRSWWMGNRDFVRFSPVSETYPVSNASDVSVLVPRSVFGEPRSIQAANAPVPVVPPQHRPVDWLGNYFILWEAEWTDVPKDPYLLKRIGASLLFAVIDSWDLTELERMVMRSVYRAPRR